MTPSVVLAAAAAVDPALEGRELGVWHMVPAVATVPAAAIVAAALVWYFVRLGRPSVPSAVRWLRRVGIVFALAGLGPLVRALSFVHPHEDRVGWAAAWSMALFAAVVCSLLALVDMAVVLRGGLREYIDMRKQVFGGSGQSARGGGDG